MGSEMCIRDRFKYIAFIEDRNIEDFIQGGKQSVVRYKRFSEFLVTRLQEYLDASGPLPDVDGVFRIIKAPSSNLVLSDVNIGVETSANPDTTTDMAPAPVRVDFRQLYFNVQGKGEFGFKGGTYFPD